MHLPGGNVLKQLSDNPFPYYNQNTLVPDIKYCALYVKNVYFIEYQYLAANLIWGLSH